MNAYLHLFTLWTNEKMRIEIQPLVIIIPSIAKECAMK